MRNAASAKPDGVRPRPRQLPSAVCAAEVLRVLTGPPPPLSNLWPSTGPTCHPAWLGSPRERGPRGPGALHLHFGSRTSEILGVVWCVCRGALTQQPYLQGFWNWHPETWVSGGCQPLTGKNGSLRPSCLQTTWLVPDAFPSGVWVFDTCQAGGVCVISLQ